MTGSRANWAALTTFLAARPPDEGSVTLSWEELGSIVGGVPDSAVQHHPQWWHGDRSHVRAWQAAGYAASEIQRGHSVTFRRAGAAAPVRPSPWTQRENRATPPASPTDALLELQEVDVRSALLVIPCSKTKRPGGGASSQRATRWPSALAAAREHNRAAADLDERQLMPAWRRYSGHFYAAADAALRDAVSSDASLIILSGGYGLLRANESNA
ncbi:DUF7662 domain-containing protein [Actinomadura sp. 3N407]|uniref:DUF7662 domain-containing protein n=1 Tax=Actinomadura sp. 3N407 TaxID=3457423 RepID=UPI003FCD8BDF